MQHHDGITATSKTYIEDELQNRMDKASDEIINSLSKIHGYSDKLVCKLFEDQNSCVIPDS